MHVVVVANGELPSGGHGAVRSLLRSADHVIAADGGLRHCRTLDVWPDQLVGDLDSAPPEIVTQAAELGIEVHKWPANKDATDLELALERAVSMGASQVTVATGFGGRLDHELATLGLVAADRWAGMAMAATDGRRSVWIVRDKASLSLPVGATLSLVPWGGPAAGVTTTGLQWPLHGEPLDLGSTRGVSNVAAAPEQTVSLRDGVLLAVSDVV